VSIAGAFALALLALALLAPSADAVLSGGFGIQRRETATIKSEPLQYHGGPVLHSSDAYAIYWDPTGTYRGDWKRLINGYFQNVGAESGTLEDVFALNSQYGDAGGGAANQSTFRGGYTDEDEYPTTGNCSEPAVACLTDAQIRTELQHVIASGALPGATGPAVYYLLTPPGVVVCTDGGGSGNCSNTTSSSPPNGICGYHAAINPGSANPIVYAVQPWVAGIAGLFIESRSPVTTSGVTPDELACQGDNGTLEEPNQIEGLNPFGNYAEGLADLIIADLSVEQRNIVVDPLLNGWYQTATKAEQGDMCQRDFGPEPETPPTPNPLTHAASLSDEEINGVHYYLPWAFDSTGLTSGRGFFCSAGDNLEPHFTAPNPVNSGDVVGFDATESNITLLASTKGLPADEPFVVPSYKWDFGDGTVVSGGSDASVFHSYQYGGEYTVTLTVTDSGRNSDSYSQGITVVGPTRPSDQGGGGSTPAAASVPAADSSAAPAAPAASPAKVTATQAVPPTSLSSALRSGLVVHYSVSGQVAGRFEVLLASSIAKKIGLKGPAATGLAKGTPAQIVIAKAILVTTKGGHSNYRIKFSKATAVHLRKLHKVSLMIRMVVHNASSPVATTVLSTVNLGH